MLYIHFSYLNAWARTFHLILIRSSKNRHLCLVLLVRSIQSFTDKYNVSYKFSEKALSHVKKFTSILSLVRVCITDVEYCHLVFVNLLIVPYFFFTEMVNCNIRFPNTEKSCIPRTNPAWSSCITLLLYCWIQLDILLKIFASLWKILVCKLFRWKTIWFYWFSLFYFCFNHFLFLSLFHSSTYFELNLFLFILSS